MAFEPRAEVFDDIAPHPDGVDAADELIHERAYVVRSYRKGPDRMVMRGAIRDQKPPRLYISEDPDPLTVHHMVVDLEIEVPTLVITAARAALEVHPHAACPKIADHYGNLVGLSVARGFTHKVRELFGGPRGCTHTTALLQAMAPVAIQSMWSFRIAAAKESGDFSTMVPTTTEARMQGLAMNLNTCHMWDEDGEMVAGIKRGEPMEIPVWVVERLQALGRDPQTWRATD